MSRKTTITIALAAAMLATPLVAAYGMKGNNEPDTLDDKTHTFMWPSSDTSACGTTASPCLTEKIYFNGYMHQGAASVGTDISENLAILQTQLFIFDQGFGALLGAWKDCNGDGYVGLGDQGLWDYHAEILAAEDTADPSHATVPGTSICPQQTVDASHVQPGVTGKWSDGNWFPVHNDGTWIREFIPIGWSNAQSVVGDANQWDINDAASRVWMDMGKPTDGYAIICHLSPNDRGTFHSVGGLLHEYDCREGFTVTRTESQVADSTPTTQPFSFTGHETDPQNSNSQANQKNPWGEDSDASYVSSPWDCSNPNPLHAAPPSPIVGVGDKNTNPSSPTYSLAGVGGAGLLFGNINVSMPRAAVPGANAAGSPAGTINEVGSGFDQCHRPTGTDANNGNAPQGLVWEDSADTTFHAGKSTANAPYALEADVSTTSTRVAADIPMTYGSDSYPHSPYSVALGQSTPNPTTIGLTGNIGTWGGNFQPPNPFFLHRFQLTTGPVYNTYFAVTSVGSMFTAAKLPGGATATGKYGQENCGGFTSGVHNGWQCAGSLWYVDDFGSDMKQQYRSATLGPRTTGCDTNTNVACTFYAPALGQMYNLRDVDCYDNSATGARDAGVGWGVATGEHC